MAILLTENLKVEHVEVREERGHRVAVVRLDAAGEERNRARDLGLRKERHDADLREAAVVDLGDEALSLLLRRGVLRQVERVEEVERDRVRDLHVAVVHERRVHARLAALHVVRVERALAPELKERDDRDNLPLGRERDRVPLGLRGAAGERRHVTLEGLRPRELDAVGAREVADERSHGNTAVLDLGVAKEANGGLLGGAPEVLLSKVERVEELDRRVALARKLDKVRLGLGNYDGSARRGRRADRREGRGANEGESEDDSAEHGYDFVAQ
mmetsp:Transcript_7247/g.15053  ORF Transcript_7247/g.15053 Transcript_7247/m.15053 type:complete len:272 (+) Transcript_7247:210-1025(+)